MRKILQAMPAILVLLLPVTFLVCTTSSPSNPFAGTPGVGGVPGTRSNLPTVKVTANRYDVDANGSDSVVVTATARNAAQDLMPGAQILWNLSSRNFTGSPGTLSTPVSFTNDSGQATSNYRAASLDFVPVGAIVVVTATLSVPNNPEGSPKASVTLLIRPKGNAPTTTTGPGSTGPVGTIPDPVISAVTPDVIKVDASPPVTVVIQGLNFSEESQVLLVTSETLITIGPQFLSNTQLRFSPPVGLAAGRATLFVTGPGNVLSDGFPVTLTTGVSQPPVDTKKPTIQMLLPAQGPVGVGKSTTIILLGDGFSVNPAVCSATSATSNITFVNQFVGVKRVCPIEAPSAQRLVVQSPTVADDQAGPVDVFVTNEDGSISNTVTFTYVAGVVNAPVIQALAPSAGPTTGETRVVITGANFKVDDSVVIAGPAIFSPPGDVCDDGFPVCSGNQCVLNEARGGCVINGTYAPNPFERRGPGQIEIVMPNVGTSAAGSADVLIRTAAADTSNIEKFLFVPPSELAPPSIAAIDPAQGYVHRDTSPSAPPYNFEGFTVIILGSNFRKCSSVILRIQDEIHEILPTPDVADCGIQRGSEATETPRQRLQRLLPPDGMSIQCLNRRDLVPFRRKAGCSSAALRPPCYVHDLICYDAGLAQAYAPFEGQMVPAPGEPNDVTSGGAITWVNEAEVRVLYGPRVVLPCKGSETSTVYVSNDPGRGLSGDQISNGVPLPFSHACD